MPQITVRELVEKAREMRLNQKAYFKNRTKGALIASKQSEKELDEMIETIQANGEYLVKNGNVVIAD